MLTQLDLFPNLPKPARLDTWAQRFSHWQQCNSRLTAIADRIRQSKRLRAELLYRAHFGHSMPYANCLHNWAIGEPTSPDDRAKKRVYRLCLELLDDWRASEAARVASRKIWHRLRLNDSE